MAGRREALALPRKALLIALLPLTVYILSEGLLLVLGATEVAVPQFSTFNAHAEAAARYRVLATCLLVIGAAVAAIGYFVLSLPRLIRESRNWTIGASLAMSAFMAAAIFGPTLFGTSLVTTQQMMGEQLVVKALSQRVETEARVREQFAKPQEARRAGADAADQTTRMSDYRRLRILIGAESFLLALAIPALAFGSIMCLAWPRPPTPPKEAALIRDEQIGRLSTFLYLSAFLLVSGLLFLSAFLHWPLFALPEAARAAYREHIHAVVLFNGVTYTLLLAAYYLPVAGLLARRWQGVLREDGSSASGDMLDWRGFLKAALAVFAPLIVGLLGEVMKLPLAVH